MKIPQYRLHKPSGRAFIEIRYKRHYLGKYDSAESRKEYSRLLNEYLAGVDQSPLPKSTTVAELVSAFMEVAEVRYRKHGQPTSEVRSFETALAPVAELYGELPANDFGPLKLKAVRQTLIAAGYCRTRINGHVSRIRRCWKWGVSQESVSESTWTALLSVEGLRSGEAPDRDKILPVEENRVLALKPFLSPVVWGMTQVQLWTGCRPGEVCMMRMCDLKMTGDVWEFVPESHKTEHHGRRRVVFLGQNAQNAIRPFLRTETHVPLFSPNDSKEWFLSQRRAARKTPLTPSQKKRKRKKNPKRKPRDEYTVTAYGRSIKYACKRANVKAWHPNQLRHAAGTRFRSLKDLESARVILGHASSSTTEIYAEADFEKAREIIRLLG